MSSQHRGIPTTYKGINFRSRLEARWAVLFDNLSWRWEYEPESEGAYIPDFLLHGSAGRRVYVEVKPLTIYQRDRKEVVSKARSALGGDVDLLVLCEGFQEGDFGEARLGFLPSADPLGSDEKARLVRTNSSSRSVQTFDFNETWGDWTCKLSGHYEGNAGFSELTFADAIQLWNVAGNCIQWKPVEAKAKTRRERIAYKPVIPRAPRW